MCNPQFYVSGKRPMVLKTLMLPVYRHEVYYISFYCCRILWYNQHLVTSDRNDAPKCHVSDSDGLNDWPTARHWQRAHVIRDIIDHHLMMDIHASPTRLIKIPIEHYLTRSLWAILSNVFTQPNVLYLPALMMPYFARFVQKTEVCWWEDGSWNVINIIRIFITIQ